MGIRLLGEVGRTPEVDRAQTMVDACFWERAVGGGEDCSPCSPSQGPPQVDHRDTLVHSWEWDKREDVVGSTVEVQLVPSLDPGAFGIDHCASMSLHPTNAKSYVSGSRGEQDCSSFCRARNDDDKYGDGKEEDKQEMRNGSGDHSRGILRRRGAGVFSSGTALQLGEGREGRERTRL